MNQNKNYELKKDIKKIRWLLCGVMLSLFASEVLFQAFESFMSRPVNNYIRMAVVETAAFVIPFFLYGNIAAKKLSAKDELHLKGISFKKASYALGLGITGQFVIMLLNLPLEYIYQTFLLKKETAELVNPVSVSALLIALLAAGIIPAFFEELLMRGVVFRAYNKISTKAAVIFTTFVFVVFHGKPECIVGYVFMGYMASFIMMRCDSLYGAMLYHFASNAAAIIFSMLAAKLVSVVWILLTVMTVLFIIILICFKNSFSAEERIISRRSGKLVLSSIFSLPVLISLAVIILKYWLLNLR